jgi:hypothetical protein
MIPKEKAKELVDKYSTYVVMWAGGIETSKQNVKQCALIAVDEILKISCLKPLDYKDYFNNNSEFINYWIEVKQEIEKL